MNNIYVFTDHKREIWSQTMNTYILFMVIVLILIEDKHLLLYSCYSEDGLVVACTSSLKH